MDGNVGGGDNDGVRCCFVGKVTDSWGGGHFILCIWLNVCVLPFSLGHLAFVLMHF